MKKNIAFLPALASLFLLALMIYFPSFNAPFVLDDHRVIVGNPAIVDVLNWAAIWNFDPLRFLTNLTFAVNFAIGGEYVLGYHVVNFLIHSVNGLLVFRLSRQLLLWRPTKAGEDDAFFISFFAAALFLAHPIQTSAVTYIVQRGSLLGCTLYLLTVLFYLHFQKTAKINLYLISLSAFALAVLSKPHVMTLPLILILLHIFFLPTKSLKKNAGYLLGYCVIALTIPVSYMLWKFHAIGLSQFIASSYETSTISRHDYFLTQINVIVTYLRLLFVPVYQNLDYDYPLTIALWNMQTLYSLAVLSALMFMGIKLFHKQRILSFCIFWFFITISLESGLIPISDVIFEHRLYLPSVGFAIFVNVFLYERLRNIHLFNIVLSLWLVMLCVLTFQRNRIWSDKIVFLEDIARKSPQKPRVLDNLGIAYWEEGRQKDALEVFEKVLELDPKRARTYAYAGVVYGHEDKLEKAHEFLTKAIALDPTFEEAYNNRGIIYMKMGKFDLADDDFARALLLNDKNVQAHANRSFLWLREGRYLEALDTINKAIGLDPNNERWFIYKGSIFEKMNKPVMALEAYTQAVKLNPANPENFDERGKLLFKQQKYELALRDFEKVEALDPRHTDARINQGNIYAQLGQYDKAIGIYSKIIQEFPTLAKPYYYRSLVYYLTENSGKALEDALKAQEKGYALEEGYLQKLQNLQIDKK